MATALERNSKGTVPSTLPNSGPNNSKYTQATEGTLQIPSKFFDDIINGTKNNSPLYDSFDSLELRERIAWQEGNRPGLSEKISNIFHGNANHTTGYSKDIFEENLRIVRSETKEVEQLKTAKKSHKFGCRQILFSIASFSAYFIYWYRKEKNLASEIKIKEEHLSKQKSQFHIKAEPFFLDRKQEIDTHGEAILGHLNNIINNNQSSDVVSRNDKFVVTEMRNKLVAYIAFLNKIPTESTSPPASERED